MRAQVDEWVAFASLASESVREFQRVFGLSIRDAPTIPPQHEVDLRAALLIEESEEYFAASVAGDMVGMADGLGDIVVITAGSALVYGLDLPSLVEAFGVAPWPLRRAVSVATTPFVSLDELGEALAAVVVSTYVEAERHGVPLEAVFREIHHSNMTKLDSDGSVLRRADGKVLKGPNYRSPFLAPILAAAGLLPAEV